MTQSSFSRAYLARLALDDTLFESNKPTADKLFKFQQAHLENICFENLAQHGAIGGPPGLDLEVTKEKILRLRRGGFCMEVNGLFAEFLEEQGYQVKRFPSTLCIGKDEDGAPTFRDCGPTHLALLVTDCEQQEWYVDVGLGEPPLHPLRYRLDESQVTPEGMQSRFVQDDDKVSLQWFQEERWKTRLQWSVEDARRNLPYESFAPYLAPTLEKTSRFCSKVGLLSPHTHGRNRRSRGRTSS